MCGRRGAGRFQALAVEPAAPAPSGVCVRVCRARIGMPLSGTAATGAGGFRVWNLRLAGVGVQVGHWEGCPHAVPVPGSHDGVPVPGLPARA